MKPADAIGRPDPGHAHFRSVEISDGIGMLIHEIGQAIEHGSLLDCRKGLPGPRAAARAAATAASMSAMEASGTSMP
jgi:hypothetical protein